MSLLQILTSHMGLLAVASALFSCILLQAFSRRMSEVTRIGHRHRWFHLGNAFIAVALFGHLTLYNASLAQQPPLAFVRHFATWAFHLPLVLGIAINLVITLIYWGWLLHKH